MSEKVSGSRSVDGGMEDGWGRLFKFCEIVGLYIKYLEGLKEKCPTVSVSELAQEISSQEHSGTKVRSP